MALLEDVSASGPPDADPRRVVGCSGLQAHRPSQSRRLAPSGRLWTTALLCTATSPEASQQTVNTNHGAHHSATMCCHRGATGTPGSRWDSPDEDSADSATPLSSSCDLTAGQSAALEVTTAARAAPLASSAHSRTGSHMSVSVCREVSVQSPWSPSHARDLTPLPAEHHCRAARRQPAGRQV